MLVSLAFSGCGGSAASPAKSSAKAARSSGQIVIAGLVTDALGFPVPRLPVRIIASSRPLQSDPRLGLKRGKLLVSGTTASDGTYRLIFPAPPGSKRFYLSFYLLGLFDEVRFARPARIDITAKVRAKKPFIFDHELTFHGAWDRVQKTIRAYPKSSPKARVIRRYGIAEEIRKAGKGTKTEVWWYYSRGKRFDFDGDKIVAEKNFSPIFK